MDQSSLWSARDLRVKRVSNWVGSYEYMIELIGLEECIGYGDTFTEAKRHLEDSIQLWIRNNGDMALPELTPYAQLIILEQPMTKEEFAYINQELLALDQA